MTEYYHFLTKKNMSCFIKNIMLNLRPIKPQKLPDHLIYRTQKQISYDKIIQIARIISLKDGQLKGAVEFFPALAYRNGSKKEPSVFIYVLQVFDRKKGYGTKLLNYVKNYSKEIGCNGNLWLDSSPCLLPQEIPHTFYRKFGMTTDNKKIDKQLDKFIKQHKIPTHRDMCEVLMFYPENKPEPKENIFKRIWKKLFF